MFDRVGHGEGVEEVDMKKLLMDPVAVEWLDSLTCYTLPVSLHYTVFYTAQKMYNRNSFCNPKNICLPKIISPLPLFLAIFKDLQAVLRARSAGNTAD